MNSEKLEKIREAIEVEKARVYNLIHCKNPGWELEDILFRVNFLRGMEREELLKAAS